MACRKVTKSLTPLFQACKDNDVSIDVLNELLQSGKHDPNDDGNFQIVPHSHPTLAKMGCVEYEKIGTPLDVAIERKNLEKVRLLLKHGAYNTKYILTPVVKAMLCEDLLELQKLAKTQDADFKTGLSSFTPLRISLILHDWDYFYLLLLKGVVPNTKDAFIQFLVETDSDYFVFPHTFKTRFEFFQKYGGLYTEYYRSKNGSLFRKTGIEAIRGDSKLETLHFIQLVDKLGYFENKLKRKPSLLQVLKPNRHFRERTHLKSAIFNQDVKAVHFLLQQPCIDVNHSRGFPPLHAAIWRTQNAEIIRLLLQHEKININLETSSRKTPYLECLEYKEHLLKEMKDLEKRKEELIESKRKRCVYLQPQPQEEEEDEDYESSDDDLSHPLPVPRPVPRLHAPMPTQHILGSTPLNSEEGKAKVEAYWISAIEQEIRSLQQKYDDKTIETLLLNHPGICLKPRITFTPKTFDSTQIHRFGYKPNCVFGKELWIACYQGNLTDVEHYLSVENVDLHYYMNLPLTPVGRYSWPHLRTEDKWIYNPEMLQYNGYTPLHLACLLGFKRIVERLLQHPEIDVNLPALSYEETFDSTDERYLIGVVLNEKTPYALASNSEIQTLLRNHPSFAIEHNLQLSNVPIMSLPEIVDFYTTHQTHKDIIPFCEKHLQNYYWKTPSFTSQDYDHFKQVFARGLRLTMNDVKSDDPEFVRFLLSSPPNAAMPVLLSAFQSFVETQKNKAAQVLADHLPWALARNLSKSKRHVRSVASRKFLYAHRVKPVEVWALNSLRTRLNSNVVSIITQFVLESP